MIWCIFLPSSAVGSLSMCVWTNDESKLRTQTQNTILIKWSLYGNVHTRESDVTVSVCLQWLLDSSRWWWFIIASSMVRARAWGAVVCRPPSSPLQLRRAMVVVPQLYTVDLAYILYHYLLYLIWGEEKRRRKTNMARYLHAGLFVCPN